MSSLSPTLPLYRNCRTLTHSKHDRICESDQLGPVSHGASKTVWGGTGPPTNVPPTHSVEPWGSDMVLCHLVWATAAAPPPPAQTEPIGVILPSGTQHAHLWWWVHGHPTRHRPGRTWPKLQRDALHSTFVGPHLCFGAVQSDAKKATSSNNVATIVTSSAKLAEAMNVSLPQCIIHYHTLTLRSSTTMQMLKKNTQGQGWLDNPGPRHWL